MRSDTDFPRDLQALEADYELIRELVQGGMTGVYLARRRDSGRLVAIKAIRSPFLDDIEALRRFAREAGTVAELDHPNIVRTEAIEQIGDRAVAIIMAYVAGGTVRDRLREYGAFDAQRAESVLRDVANALAYAHGRGIVHRDVKPENVFLEEHTGRALLSDFGIARRIEGDVQITMLGGALGTPQYMSPEQIDGEDVDGRTDIYSLGVLGWELLTGKRPWAGENLYGIIYKQKHEQLPRITSLRPRVPANLLFAIEGALKKDRSERWQTAEQFIEQLTYNPPPVLSQSYPAPAEAPANEPTLQFRRPAPEVFEGDAAGPMPAPSEPVESLGAGGVGEWTGPPVETAYLRRSLGRREEPGYVTRALGVLVPLVVAGAVLLAFLGVLPALWRRGPSTVVRSSAGNVALDTGPSAASSPRDGRTAPSASELESSRAESAHPPGAGVPPLDPALSRPAAGASGTSAAPVVAGARRARSRLPAEPSPRCRVASLPDQRACLSAYLEAIDAPMELVYESLVGGMRRAAETAPGAPDPRAVVRLRSLQREWARARERTCRAKVVPGSVPRWATPLAECYAEQAARRADELRAALRPLRDVAR